jgi:hypothetical protein
MVVAPTMATLATLAKQRGCTTLSSLFPAYTTIATIATIAIENATLSPRVIVLFQWMIVLLQR